MNASQVQQTPGLAGMGPRLTVIIVNYNGWPDVLQLVSALVAEPEFGSGELQVVVVDNASPDPIPERLRLILPPACGYLSGRIMAVSPWASMPDGDWLEATGCSC